MYIESIYIVSFGGLSNFGLELFDGLNIIEGKNESGKVQSAILSVLSFTAFREKETGSIT